MWSSRLFWKLFVSYTVLNLAATVTFVVIVSGWQQDQVIEQIRQRLHDSAALVRSDLSDLLPSGRTDGLQAKVRLLGREIDTRITLVTMDGHVLADSTKVDSSAVAEMENHKGRLELVRAAAQGHGTSERVSPTIGVPMLYVALRVDQDGAMAGFVRTALPMIAIRAQVRALQALIWIVAILVSIAVVGLTYFVAARVAGPVSSLTQAAEAIAGGDYQHPLFVRSNDEIGTLAKSFSRMTEQLAAREAQLRESSRRLVTVLEGMVEGVIALDDRERIVLANAAAGRLLGFSPAEAEGKPLLNVARNHVIHEALARPQGDSGTQQLEVELGGDDNRVLSFNMTMLSAEPSTRCILVLHDVTELRRLESVRQEFVANVSHELKTPLSSIKAYAETLLNGAIADDEHNTRFVRRIEEQAERLHELILDMLSIARIESRQHEFEIGRVNVTDIVKACIAEHQAAADARTITLIAPDSSSDVSVNADEEGVRQILDNLIDNALNYTPDGGSVTVSCRAEKSWATIEVRDTGIGIAAKFLPRVFERFFRVDKARSREVGGTGLGLSIVKHLAQAFAGTVNVESQVGVGTLFTVKLPVA
jgi:two-component system, OmpR family, phosphate regulon sensor histidine kinase PhoR